MNFNVHKDNSPYNTVKKIRNILTDLDLFPYESKWYSVTNNCYSLTLSSMELPDCSTNGKGISRPYALASAYGEFIERLQGNYLIKKKYGLMQMDFSYPGDIIMSLGDYAEKNKNVIENIMDPVIVKEYYDHKIKLFPSYEVINGEIKYLPYFLNLACIANGLSAGNTPEEALCQGICEIFERYAIKEIYNSNIELPTIPLSLIKDLEIYRIIDDILKKGYDIIIKDCTFNKFPVLSVILVNKKKNTSMCIYGSDPIFEVALQRCLTELFQGKDEEILKRLDNKNKLNFSSDQFMNKQYSSPVDNKKVAYKAALTWGTIGEVPNHVFLSGKVSNNFNSYFQNTFKSHKNSLKFLTEIIRKNKYKMYIQDISTLGFPTYRVFIPELSAVEKISSDKFKILNVERTFIKSILLNLKKSSPEEILKCSEYLEMIMNIPYFYFWCRQEFIKVFTDIIIDKSSHINQFNHLAYFLGMLFFRLKNYEKSFKYLDLYIKEEEYKIENTEYYSCVLLYLRLKSDKKPENEISTVLKNTFGKKLSQEVIDDLSKPEDCFKHFILPECGDCSSCPINKECYYDKWKEINIKIINKIKDNPVKQEDISKIFKDTI